MKRTYKHYLLSAFLIAGTGLGMTSCNDFLDLAPQDQVTPDTYLQKTDQLGAYAIYYYPSVFTTPSGEWSVGPIMNGDGNTDNMVVGESSQSYYTKDYWKTGTNGDLGLSAIRYCNYFFEKVLPKYEAGVYADDEVNAKHYIGEMYVIRAAIYFSRLRTYGDYPIVTTVPEDNKEALIAVGKRMPRNEVADFILQDLDKAIELLQNKGFEANNRINKQVALLLKSRVALYEASYEKYHKGTGRVPGDTDWPGYKVHPNYTLDVDAHVKDLLTQAMEAAKTVADATTLTTNSGVLDQTDPTAPVSFNPYYEMYTSQDLSNVNEVLMWRAYGTIGTTNITHGVSNFGVEGSNNGLLRNYVENFLMANGLPIYAANSGYQGDETIDQVKEGRDGRLQLFMFGESNWLPLWSTSKTKRRFKPVLVAGDDKIADRTGYRMRKGADFDKTQNVRGKQMGTEGQIVFRGVEAYLNYMEAQYMRDGNVDGTSDKYWKAIRTRAKVDADYNKTIAATDMNEEAKVDWGAYSGGKLIDATLYNIRRERRCEFIGEGMRWNDLVRWCAMDQLKTKNFIPEGVNFWTSMYKIPGFNGMDDNTKVTYIEGPDDEKANVSSRKDSKYLRPYRIKKANPLYNGYTWMEAHYNSPLPIREIELLSPDESIENSVLYQTWGWATKASESAIK